MYLLGYDVGGTKIEAALFAFGAAAKGLTGFQCQTMKGELVDAAILGRGRMPTDRHLGYEQILGKLVTLANQLLGEHKIPKEKLAGIGLGVPGSIDPAKQVMLNGSTFALFEKPLGADLAQGLGVSCRVVMENDANCFALAEAFGGAGIDHFKRSQKPVAEQVSIGIILGTGVGGGFVVRGQLLSGVHGGAAEIGHSVLVPDGVACYCGRRGCAEMYLGGPALEALFHQRRYSQISGEGKVIDIFRMAENFEPAAIAVLHDWKRNLARFMGNLATFFDPDYFVLGGGMSRQEKIYEGLSEAIAQNAFLSTVRVPVYQHRLGDSAGVVGAALLAFI
jgi:predicted NBD/HSP70 family sugar kinase